MMEREPGFLGHMGAFQEEEEEIAESLTSTDDAPPDDAPIDDAPFDEPPMPDPPPPDTADDLEGEDAAPFIDDEDDWSASTGAQEHDLAETEYELEQVADELDDREAAIAEREAAMEDLGRRQYEAAMKDEPYWDDGPDFDPQPLRAPRYWPKGR